MREIRQSGSEGGGHELNPVSLPLLPFHSTLCAKPPAADSPRHGIARQSHRDLLRHGANYRRRVDLVPPIVVHALSPRRKFWCCDSSTGGYFALNR